MNFLKNKITWLSSLDAFIHLTKTFHHKDTCKPEQEWDGASFLPETPKVIIMIAQKWWMWIPYQGQKKYHYHSAGITEGLKCSCSGLNGQTVRDKLYRLDFILWDHHLCLLEPLRASQDHMQCHILRCKESVAITMAFNLQVLLSKWQAKKKGLM